MGYAETIRLAKSAIKSMIQATESFSSSNTFAGYLKSLQDVSYPVALIRLRRDTPRPIGPFETRHLLQFRIEIHHQGTGSESDLDSIINLVGEIIDQLEYDRTLGESSITNTEVIEVDYSLQPRQSAIFYYAYITLQLEILRNA